MPYGYSDYKKGLTQFCDDNFPNWIPNHQTSATNKQKVERINYHIPKIPSGKSEQERYIFLQLKDFQENWFSTHNGLYEIFFISSLQRFREHLEFIKATLCQENMDIASVGNELEMDFIIFDRNWNVLIVEAKETDDSNQTYKANKQMKNDMKLITALANRIFGNSVINLGCIAIFGTNDQSYKEIDGTKKRNFPGGRNIGKSLWNVAGMFVE